MDWTVEHDIVLLENLAHFPPCGPHRHFNLLILQHRLQTALSMEVPIDSIIDRIAVLYDVDAWAARLESSGSAVLQEPARREFEVPEQLPVVFTLAQAALARSRGCRDAGAISHSGGDVSTSPRPAASSVTEVRAEFLTPADATAASEAARVVTALPVASSASDAVKAAALKARPRSGARRALDLDMSGPPTVDA